MDTFPDFKAPGFNVDAYNARFRDSNVIIHASTKDVSYPEHWGPVSVKCAFNGNEYYELDRCRYKVDDTGFLLLNEGQHYSSYIHSSATVESFTINFSPAFVREVYAGWYSEACPHEGTAMQPPPFCERIYKHNGPASAQLFLLKRLSRDFYKHPERIEESYVLLLQALFQLQLEESVRIKKIRAVKPATQKELYQRLMRVRDYIDSSYSGDISLDQLAAVSCLNTSYLLRQFKLYFHITPRQYAIQKRMAEATRLLIKTNRSITEICYGVGYQDLTSFSKLFRQFYRVSPEVYRLQHCLKKSIFT
ncbi:MAG: AraC family transcriptional regulator [Chitinophagaceae bacterium]